MACLADMASRRRLSKGLAAAVRGPVPLESVSLLLVPIVRVPLIGPLHCASFAVQAAEGLSHPPWLIRGAITLRW